MLTKEQVEEYLESFRGEYQRGEMVSVCKTALALYAKNEELHEKITRYFNVRDAFFQYEYQEEGTDYSSEKWAELYQAKSQAEAELRAVGGKDE